MVKINQNQCNGINKLGIPAKWYTDTYPQGCELDLSGSEIIRSNLKGVSLNHSDMSNSDLQDVNFSNSDIRLGRFKGARIDKSEKDEIEWVD